MMEVSTWSPTHATESMDCCHSIKYQGKPKMDKQGFRTHFILWTNNSEFNGWEVILF